HISVQEITTVVALL
nr:immunoglobulin heavy chain junction region [Mus musculus]